MKTKKIVVKATNENLEILANYPLCVDSHHWSDIIKLFSQYDLEGN